MNRLSCIALLAAAAAPAQDMIAVSWSGSVYALDSFTGSATLLGNGAFGQNALASANGSLWSTTRISIGNYALTTVDPTTGAATVLPGSFIDVRGLASAGGSILYGIEDASPDQLVLIDVATLQVTPVGPTGFGSIQCLATMDGVLYAYDNTFGLLIVDPATGAATDVDPAVPGNGDMQWLARRADGKLVGGRNALYEIDVQTGVATLIGGSVPDFRGAEPAFDLVSNFGIGCNGAFGQVTSTATITGGANPQLTLSSTNHEPNTVGLVLFGISSSQTNGVPLPLNVDPIFGTQGCSLYVSLDVSLLATTTGSSPATMDLTVPILPSWPGNSLLVQHATLENVPGGLSLSDAVAVQFGL
ncbi:MAG: hypothetical protein KAI24_21650 [Planctomycetes bacterium]|nr:hypothetical protein [Planctomycetota bacterium]